MKRTPYLFIADTPMAQRLRTMDWDSGPLGSPEHWDAALKTLVPIMLASSQPMFIVWGPARSLIYNDGYAEILAAKHPAAMGHDFLEVWHEIRESLTPIVEAAYRGEPVQMDHIELWMERRGFREETHFSFFYSPVRAESGEVGGFFCACNEITAQILAERRLSESEARHRGVLENMEEGFTLFDRDFNILEVNEASMRMVKLTRQELVGHNHWTRFPGTYESAVGSLYRDVAAGGGPRSLEHLYRFADGRERWFEVRAFTVGDCIASVFQDVTERRRLQEDLSTSFERLQLALDAGAIVGAWVWNIPEDRFVADNRFALSFGLDAEKLKTGMPVAYAFTAIHPDDTDRVKVAIDRAMTEGGAYRAQYRVLRDGTYRWVEACGRAEFDGGGTPSRFPGVLLDIEERRRVEAERDRMLEALQLADRRKDEFLAMLAHELRNPLAPINTAAHMLKLSGTDVRRVADASEIISRQVGHMTRLVDDLLDVSRVTRGLVQLEREPVDMRSVMSTAVEQVKPLVQSRDHELRTRIGAGSCTVSGDYHRLVQIVANLLSNAAKYTPQGGVIEVSLEPVEGRLVLTVADNGVGIAPEMIDHVFELFAQAERTPDRSQGGLGIGLALVRTLVQLHEGDVRASSAGRGQGSTFRVELPVTGAGLQTAAQDDAAPKGDALRIILVDDNADAAHTLREVLELMGHSVALAHDGKRALEQADAAAPWDAVILDIGLPDMTGYELAQRLRQHSAARDSTFIALTGYGQAHDRVISRTAGFDHHLVKPADISHLAEILARRVPNAAPLL
jgi:PAS domain S-box-containing protein